LKGKNFKSTIFINKPIHPPLCFCPHASIPLRDYNNWY